MPDIVERLRNFDDDTSSYSQEKTLQAAADEIERLRADYLELDRQWRQDAADAARWRYVRDNHTQTHYVQMSGLHYYRFSPSVLRGKGFSVDEVIDRLIAEQGS